MGGGVDDAPVAGIRRSPAGLRRASLKPLLELASDRRVNAGVSAGLEADTEPHGLVTVSQGDRLEAKRRLRREAVKGRSALTVLSLA